MGGYVSLTSLYPRLCQLARYTTSPEILSNEITRRLALVSLARAPVEQTRGPHVPILTFPEIPWMSAFLSTSVFRLRLFFGLDTCLIFLLKQTIRVTSRENRSFRLRRFSALIAWIFAHVWRQRSCPRTNLSTLWLNVAKNPINTASWCEINHYTDPNTELLWAGHDFLRFRVLCVLAKGRD